MTALRDRLVIPTAALLLLAVSSIGFAQTTDSRGRTPPMSGAILAGPGASQEQDLSVTPSEFGILDDSILQIGSASFHGRTPGSGLTFLGNGLVQPSVTGYAYWAPVFLPAGAVIDSLGLYACDTNASFHVIATLTGYQGYATPGLTDFFSVSSAQLGGNGCGYWFQAPPSPPLVVNNDVRNGGGYHYVVNISFGATGGSNLLKGVDIRWHRQVSPAPGVASFTDVPTSYWAFQYIEALKASGITVGCTPSTFCPEDPVTRAQMAVFLAKALGLHWPN